MITFSNSRTKPVFTPAAGVKWRVSEHVSVRTELRYLLSPRPDKILAPGPGASTKGWVHDFVPAIGLAAIF
jgi:hypothetical protein